MIAVYSEDNQLHRPETYSTRGTTIPARESPQRASELLLALHDGGHEVVRPRDHGFDRLQTVHDAGYLSFLESAHARWQELPEPKSHAAQAHSYAVRQASRCPTCFEGQLGYYLSSGSVPLTAQSWPSILASAQCAIEAADLVRQGASESYALCRPPGHHAYADLAGGYCYLNNAALAASALRLTHDRVAILDVDVHHGNGTQGLFYDRPDVLCVSIHADPNIAYPWYAGYAEETGSGPGVGTTLNLPLSLGTTDESYRPALQRAHAAVRDFRAGALVVSLGFDAFEGDSSDLMRVTTAGFAAIGAPIGALRLPTVLVQEGGYAVDALRRNLTSFLSGFLSARTS